jgi:hypothetical protein
MAGFRAAVGVMLVLAFPAMIPVSGAPIIVTPGEHANYDVQIPSHEVDPRIDLLPSVSQNCPQCRFIFDNNLIGYVSSWGPAQTVVWSPFPLPLEVRPYMSKPVPPRTSEDPSAPGDDPNTGGAEVPEPGSVWLMTAMAVTLAIYRVGQVVRSFSSVSTTTIKAGR